MRRPPVRGKAVRLGIAGLVKKFGGLIAWLSGSLAGVTALLYASGFLATKSADQALGVAFDLATRDPIFYIARGGGMFMSVAIISIASAVAVILTVELLRRAARRIGRLVPETAKAVQSWAATLTAPAASMSMMALVLAGLAACVIPATKAEGLLFAGPPSAEFCAGDRDALDPLFVSFAIVIGAVAGLGVAARASLLDATQWLWTCLAGFALFLALVGTPIAYGALAVKADAPRVWITPQTEDPGRMWLLSRARDGALIWLEEQGKVRWIRADQIQTLTFGRNEPIAAVMCAAANAPLKGD